MPPALPAQLEIHPLRQPFDKVVRIPGSKSLTNRALLLAALAEGTSTLTNVLFADDTRVMMAALKQLGISLDLDEATTTVTARGCGGRWPVREADLFLGNAGTAMRFLTAACCLGPTGAKYRLHGIPRMHQRPIGELVDLLRRLGATIDYDGEDGYPPLTVHGGGLRGGTLSIQPTLSSQYISAILQIAPCLPQPLNIAFDGPITSKPYVEMTTRLMARFGTHAKWTTHGVAIDPATYRGIDLAIEPDASNASYFLAAAAATGSRAQIPDLDEYSLQGDARIDGVIERMRATDGLTGIDIDLHDMPDMAQTLAALAALAKGPTTIRNVGNLRVKETDRMAALQSELTKLGAAVRIDGEDIHITPPPEGRIKPALIETYDDHRMAMSFAVIGLAQPGITIHDPACVNKTFPTFWQTLNQLAPEGETVVDLPDAVESAG
ncbi:MAG: 3-phosphoshikimate 1-carboxyvinyltransferase [Planctomycetes bacterium]|nr:3-phosphoshikimate 1-carboxyvinyltransferase [Planctomycetota bacterium]